MVIAGKNSKKILNESGLKIKILKDIEIVNEIKYLGVIIDIKLNFRLHAYFVSKRIGRKLGAPGRITSSTCIVNHCKVSRGEQGINPPYR